MDVFESLQAQALLAVLEPDHDAWMRHICRFYSKTFHVPLPQVVELPVEDLVLAYFEDRFEEMDDDGRQEVLERLLETPEERKRHDTSTRSLSKKDETFLDNLNREVEEGITQGPPKATSRKRVAQAATQAGLPAGLSKLAERVRRTKEKAEGRAGATLPKAKPMPPLPDIRMTFGGGNLTDKWSNLDPLGAPVRKKP